MPFSVRQEVPPLSSSCLEQTLSSLVKVRVSVERDGVGGGLKFGVNEGSPKKFEHPQTPASTIAILTSKQAFSISRIKEESVWFIKDPFVDFS